MSHGAQSAGDRRRTGNVAAVLLAAGRSRRMGAFKPLLPFGGKTVIERCVASLCEAGIEEIVVVLGHRAVELRESLSHLPIGFVLNEDAEGEMAASVRRGIEWVSERMKAALIALADHPAVSPQTIKFLIETQRRTGASFIIPQWRGRGGHPVLVDLQYRRELLRLDAAGGLRGLFETHAEEVLRVEVACPYVTRDMDTWEEYAALHEEIFGTLPPVGRPEQGHNSS